MQKDNRSFRNHHPRGGRLWLPIIAFGGLIAFFLLYEHRAHIPANAVFFLGFLLFCGVMHMFMHRGHAGHGAGHGRHEDRFLPPSDNQEGPGQ